VLVAADDAEQPFEFLAGEAERMHVCADEILAKTFVHLDDYRPRETRLCHHEVVTFDTRLNTTSQFADVAELLPGDPPHALALKSGAAS
jgi:hypothetical protein